MTNTNEISMLIQNIDNAEMNATISVMESLIQCYQKEITIQENCSCDISEFSIYQEADDASSDEKDTSKSKQMWNKFVSYIKLLINKLKNFFTKVNATKIKEKYDKLENKNIVIPAGEDARLMYYFDGFVDAIGVNNFSSSKKEDVEKILNIDTSKLPILQDYPSDKDYVLSEDACNGIIENLMTDNTGNVIKVIAKVSPMRKLLFFIIFFNRSIDFLPEKDRSKYIKNGTKLADIAFNGCFTEVRIFNKYVNKEYKKQSAKNGKPEPTGESFYVDDEFDDFDFYDEGFKDIAKAAWNGKGSNESKIKKILMFIPRLLMQLFKAVGNLWKNRKSQQLVKRLDELEKQIKDKDSEINKLKDMVRYNPDVNGRIDELSSRLARYFVALNERIYNIEDRIEKNDEKYMYRFGVDERDMARDVKDLKAAINFMNGYIPTGGFNIPEMEDLLIDVMSAMEQLRKLKKEECTLEEFVNKVYDGLKKCADPKFGHTNDEGIAVSDARRHFESLLSFTNKYSRVITRITRDLNNRSNEMMSLMFDPENAISNKTLDQTTINKMNEITGFVKSIQLKLDSFDKYSTGLLDIADFILDKGKLRNLFGDEFIDD